MSQPLTKAAQDYAALMAEYDWFDHIGPDGSTLSTRAESAGYTGGWLGEVLYRGSASGVPTEVIVTWLGSPSHRSVMLGEQFADVGVGCAISNNMRWCVQDFGGP